MAQAAVYIEEINEEELKLLSANDSKPVLLYESPKKEQPEKQIENEVKLPDVDHQSDESP